MAIDKYFGYIYDSSSDQMLVNPVNLVPGIHRSYSSVSLPNQDHHILQPLEINPQREHQSFLRSTMYMEFTVVSHHRVDAIFHCGSDSGVCLLGHRRRN